MASPFLLQVAEAHPSAVLVGLESSGKSTLFRQLTGEDTGQESNFRGSTVQVRRANLADSDFDLVDTPGIRVKSDSVTTRLALECASTADVLVIVVRATHLGTELNALLTALELPEKEVKCAVVITFKDKATPELERSVHQIRKVLSVPTVLVNARQMTAQERQEVVDAIRSASPLRQKSLASVVAVADVPVVQPSMTIFEHPTVGPWAAVVTMLLMFAVPVALAYLLSQWLQPVTESMIIAPIVAVLEPLEQLSPLLHSLLVGSYGLLTLGWYSFLWAFPVVLFIGLSVAVVEETGVKDRITGALDPWMRHVGLHGRDLIPVLTGFGCNVVAVLQSRACSNCSRRSCVSLIAFGSACSYQIGASLSLFGSAGMPYLFAPYLFFLFLVGVVHTRVWESPLNKFSALPLSERAFLQKPTLRGLWWRVRAVVSQFLTQAMPIFLLICAVGTLLQWIGVMDRLASVAAPFVYVLGLPVEVAPGVIFSIIRKDGLLVLNMDQGALIRSLSAGQLLVLVWLASTLTACLVTLWTIRKELGFRFALTLAGRQTVSSLVSTVLLAGIVQLLS